MRNTAPVPAYIDETLQLALAPSCPLTSLPAPPQPAVALEAEPKRGEAACPDIPSSVGALLALAYAAILGAFALVFLASEEALFTIGICAFYLAVYVGVPLIFFRVEGRSPARTSFGLRDFLHTGLHTSTGYLRGADALAQMLTVPVCLIFAVVGIGVIFRLSQA